MNSEEIKQKMRQHVPSLKTKELVLEKLSGLTNVTYAIYVDQEPLFVFKTFSDGFDRQMENRIVQTLSDRSLSPRIIMADHSYRIQEFLRNTRHPTNEQLAEPALQRRIVEHMHVFHQVPLVQNQPTLADHLFSPRQRRELSQYKNSGNGKVNQQLFVSLFNQVEEILADSESLKEILLPTGRSSLRLCHNDLNNLNILFEGEKMHFIDYDYVGSNFLAYDIANFIAESSIDYSLPNYPGFTVIKHFSKAEISDIAHMYPGYYEGLDVEVLMMLCVSCLYWAVWSIKRFTINKSENFGVAEHGLMRLNLYHYYSSLLSQTQSLT